MFYRRHVCAGEKRGLQVGPTKRGKGTKIMGVADGHGLPLAVCTASASPAEVKLARQTMEERFVAEVPERLVGDKAYDSDKLDQEMMAEFATEVIAPHRRGRRPKHRTQDGRSLRRYRRRWKVERMFAWLYNFRRLVVRSAFGQAYYPVSRFQRIEGSLRFANVDDARLSILEPYSRATLNPTDDPTLETNNRPGINYLQPSTALVFDNSLFGYTAPFYGRRYRLEFAQTLGDWKFSQVTADYRRYDGIVGPIVLASRLLYFGRIGRDADRKSVV